MALVNSLASLFQHYFSGEFDVISPNHFVTTFKTMPALDANFNNGIQQDAVNFLLSLLDELHLELNGLSVTSQWDEFVFLNNSIIIDNFYGCQQSVFQCRLCEYSHEVKDPFTCLNVPIPVVSKTCSLYSCLDLYFTAENDVAEYTCLNCEIEGGVSKTFRLFVTPEILMITLKRFDGIRNKNNCFIEFPVRDLNMNTYLAANCVEGLNFMYDLYAVVRHSGGLHGGHYTAACKQHNKWYNFDDNKVTEIQEVGINSDSAYILFYKKQKDQVHALETDVVVFSDDVKRTFILPAIHSIYVEEYRSHDAPRWVRSLSKYWKPEENIDLYDDFGDVYTSYTELANYQQVKNFVCSTGVKNLTNDNINEILCLQSSYTTTESSIQHKFGAALIDAILLYER